MKRAVLLALLLAACHGQQTSQFQNVSVTLPEDTAQLPDGPNVDLVRTTCTGCHSAEMILVQPRLDAKAWTATVEKMAKVYKAPVDPKDIPAIVAYLDATNARLAH
jgi:cytochrome c5